jgi:mRNA interferase MazF
VERGEVWWALVGERCPVVLLTGDGDPEVRAVQIVAPATAEQKRGFTILSGEQAADPDVMRLVIASTGTGVRGVVAVIGGAGTPPFAMTAHGTHLQGPR